MKGPSAAESTQILLQAAQGDAAAAAQFMPLVYGELRQLAEKHFRHQRPDHTLQPTALVHEAYLRLVQSDKVDWKGRTHFFATAARVMRQILVDHARAQRAAKRGGSRNRITLSAVHEENQDLDFSDLMDVLERLSKLNPRHYEIVTLRFLAGMKVSEVAHALRISTRSVEEGWRMARAWLLTQLQKEH